MLVYLVTEDARDTIDGYLETWGAHLADRIAVVPYESLRQRPLPVAETYVFSDLERLGADRLPAADELWQAVAVAAPRARLLNRPADVLSRSALLERLHREGINSFKAFAVEDRAKVERYPVFLRYANKHWGPMTGLLRNAKEVERALLRAALLGHDPRDLIIVEFEDVRSEDGKYRKYAAFVFDGQIVPRDIVFSSDWVQRDIDAVDDASIQEEHLFLSTNPYEERLRTAAAMASIDWGRIDFGVELRRRVTIWEINTNPILVREPAAYRPEHLANQRRAAELVNRALSSLVGEAGPAELGELPHELTRGLGAALRRDPDGRPHPKRTSRRAARTLAKSVARPFEPGLMRCLWPMRHRLLPPATPAAAEDHASPARANGFPSTVFGHGSGSTAGIGGNASTSANE